MDKNDAQIPTPPKIEQLRALIQIRLRHRRSAPAFVPPHPAPRYDEVFARGQQWLDQRAADEREPW